MLVSVGCGGVHSVSAGAGDMPQTIAKGSQITLIVESAMGPRVEQYEALEVKGTWVRVRVVAAPMWTKGYEGVWLNLGAIAQFSITPPVAPAGK